MPLRLLSLLTLLQGILRMRFGVTVQDDWGSETMKRSDCIFRSWGPSKSGRMLLKEHHSLFSHGPFSYGFQTSCMESCECLDRLFSARMLTSVACCRVEKRGLGSWRFKIDATASETYGVLYWSFRYKQGVCGGEVGRGIAGRRGLYIQQSPSTCPQSVQDT
jgi:hypothetical protein